MSMWEDIMQKQHTIHPFHATTVAYDSIMGKNGAKSAKMGGGRGEIKIIVQF